MELTPRDGHVAEIWAAIASLSRFELLGCAHVVTVSDSASVVT